MRNKVTNESNSSVIKSIEAIRSLVYWLYMSLDYPRFIHGYWLHEYPKSDFYILFSALFHALLQYNNWRCK